MVCGVTNTTVQKWLLAEKELSLDKAISLAQSIEVAEQGAKDLQTATTAKCTTNPDADLLKINAEPSNKCDDKNAHKPKLEIVNIHFTFADSNLNVVTVVVKSDI